MTSEKQELANSLDELFVRAGKLVTAIHQAEERLSTREHIQQRVWEIWAYCREHQESLASSTHCKAIEKVIAAAMDKQQGVIDGLIHDIEMRDDAARRQRTVIKELKADVAAQKDRADAAAKECVTTRNKLEESDKRNKTLQAEVKRLIGRCERADEKLERELTKMRLKMTALMKSAGLIDEQLEVVDVVKETIGPIIHEHPAILSGKE